MPRSFWEWVLGLLVICLPWLMARDRRRSDLATLSAVVNVLCACAYLLLLPSASHVESAIAACGLLGINVCFWTISPAGQRWLLSVVRWPEAKIVLTVLLATVVPLGLAELCCRLLADLGVLGCYQPIQTVWRQTHDDWRLATIMGDDHQEPDPVLLWRPAARKPFNSERFKGPSPEVPKPANVLRVMCYGDSLTAGPPKGGWPAWLQVLLNERPAPDGRRFEVVNAGVPGYSSHQGVLRFLQEVDRYRPDLVLVSFGWNDAADAAGLPDKQFHIPPWPIVACQRALVRYRAYRVLMYYARGWQGDPSMACSGDVQPRVTIGDYIANIDRFRTEAAVRGIPIVVLTRPHKDSPSAIRESASWRARVPDYNSALSGWAHKHRVHLIDAQGIFESLPPTLFSDECHFMPAGYQRLAELVRDRIYSGPGGLLLALQSAAPGSSRVQTTPEQPGPDSHLSTKPALSSNLEIQAALENMGRMR
jgi:lysophospholipase L1-like esterase